MCFSPEASFTASAVLITVGTVSMLRTRQPVQKLFASIPLVFGCQQLTEGILWIVLQHPEFSGWRQVSTYIFVIAGQLIWPLLVPMAILVMEKDRSRKLILKVFWVIGMLIFLYLLNNILFHPVYAQISGHHIDYEFDFPHSHNKLFSGILYFIPTVASHFISSNKKIRLMGLMVLFSLVITRIFYVQYTFSVWCFFSAVISVIVYIIIREEDSKISLPFPATPYSPLSPGRPS
jgi:hypothetical protein